ncbi:MAG: ribonuclease P protein component [Pseudomonadota bacterium]
MAAAYAFPREHRLTAKRAFDRVFKQGVRSRDAHFTVLACPNDAPGARLGLAVSRKTARRATVRNRIKRQVRESFRQVYRNLPPADFVVIAKGPSANLEGTAMRESLSRHWRRLVRKCEA